MATVLLDWHAGQEGFLFALRFSGRGFFRGMGLR